MKSPENNLASTTLFTEGGAFIKLETQGTLALKLTPRES